MKKTDILIIGGDAGGMSAASQIRRMNKDLSITVLNKGEFVSYAACGMPYFISGVVKKHSSLQAINPKEFMEKRDISILQKAEATCVDFNQKVATYTYKKKSKKIEYNKLVIATGASAFVPPIPGIENPGTFSLRDLTDAVKIQKYIKTRKPKRAILVGGGFIGLEMAEALRKKKIETTILEKMDTVALSMSPQVQKLITDKLIENDVTIKTGIDIGSFAHKEDTISINTSAGILETDMVLISIGVRPATHFLTNTELQMTERGVIVIDSKSRTNIPDVYAAGDCATVHHLLTGEETWFPMGNTANKQGRVAGLQIAGVHKEEFPGIVGSQCVKVFDLEVGKTGFNAADAERHYIDYKTEFIEWSSKPGYYPGSQPLYVNMTIDENSRQVIGCETVGTDGAVLRTNIVAAAISKGITVEELAYCDLGYTPPFSPVWDPINAAAQRFLKREIG